MAKGGGEGDAGVRVGLAGGRGKDGPAEIFVNIGAADAAE